MGNYRRDKASEEVLRHGLLLNLNIFKLPPMSGIRSFSRRERHQDASHRAAKGALSHFSLPQPQKPCRKHVGSPSYPLCYKLIWDQVF